MGVSLQVDKLTLWMRCSVPARVQARSVKQAWPHKQMQPSKSMAFLRVPFQTNQNGVPDTGVNRLQLKRWQAVAELNETEPEGILDKDPVLTARGRVGESSRQPTTGYWFQHMG